MTSTSSNSRIPVIIDTDPGVDDIIAILFAIASPELDILAFNVTLNILKVYRAIELHLELHPSDKYRFPNFNSGRKPILVRGSHAPLQGEVHGAQYFHGRDGLGNIAGRHPELAYTKPGPDHPQLTISDQTGVDVALDTLKSYPPRSVSYIVLGPMTNLALMMRKDSKTVRDRIGRVICMGGALDVPGNTSPVAEFNFYADPFAVKELLISTPLHEGLPLDRFTLVSLDISTTHELPFVVYKKAVDGAFENTKAPSVCGTKSPITHFTSSFLERTREVMLQFGKDVMELHDIVAVWCAIDHPPFPENESPTAAPEWKGNFRVFDIERTGELTRGMLVVDRREDESAYELGANRSEAQKEKDDLEHNAKLAEQQKSHIKGSTVTGIHVISETPGSQVLLEKLLNRVWNASIP
ncbi:hypothetical protein D9613_000545 [Agrocybe pediades]|uniref:Inosine/uridine-preferring nucleoside hydrolase domain-containing protein n=1 Tax=Agrocybe pediades TaxID=84607 RepID=A0A8H4VT93_9AGAR|nr:hypothetical protein D9613_000545 [Agrocybe pediades]